MFNKKKLPDIDLPMLEKTNFFKDESINCDYNSDVPKGDFSLETDDSFELNFDKTLDELKASLSSFKTDNSVLDELKARNLELERLINSYKNKSNLLKVEKDYDQLKSQIFDKEQMFNTKDDLISNQTKYLQEREDKLHEELNSLEQKKIILDAKERALYSEISSENDPRILRIIDLIDSKLSHFNQEKMLLENEKSFIRSELKRISDSESSLLNMQKESLSKKRQLEQEILLLNSRISELKNVLSSLQDKKTDLDLLIKERTQLVKSLDQQYLNSKFELKNIQDRLETEQKLMSKSRQNLEDDLQTFEREKSIFDEQKKSFYEQISLVSEKSKSELEEQKKKFYDSLKEKSYIYDQKAKELDIKEKMLLKLESEIRRREEKVSNDLDLLSYNSNKLNEKDAQINAKSNLLVKKENDLKQYESEITNLERTVLDLKAVIDKKNDDLVDKKKIFDSYISNLQKTQKIGSFEDKIKPLLNDIKKNLQSGDIFEAQTNYAKLNMLYKSSPISLREQYYELIQRLHEEISKELKKKVFTNK